jgi:Fe-S oxidoreductase
LLRAIFYGDISLEDKADQDVVFEALDLCLACKGCKAECPSAVDMAKLKYEYTNWYYRNNGNGHPIRDYLFAYITDISRLGQIVKPITNITLEKINSLGVGKRWLGLAKERKLPMLDRERLSKSYKRMVSNFDESGTDLEKVLFLSDPFSEYYQSKIGRAAIGTLIAAGCEVDLIPTVGSGRTLISKGFLASTRRHAQKVIREIVELDPSKKAYIVGIEPSEIFTLRDEYPDLFPNSLEVNQIAERAVMLDEFLIRPGIDGNPRILRIANRFDLRKDHPKQVQLHGHCYQKARPPAVDGYATGISATVQMLKSMGYQVKLIESGCCGMAGAFGFESEHFDISMKIGELSLFPAIRNAGDDTVIASSGFSCMTQIRDGTGREPVHPIELLLSDANE